MGWGEGRRMWEEGEVRDRFIAFDRRRLKEVERAREVPPPEWENERREAEKVVVLLPRQIRYLLLCVPGAVHNRRLLL